MKLPYNTLYPRTLALLVLTMLAACGTSPPVQESRELWSQGHIEEAVTRLRDASARDPQDHRLKMAYEHQRELALAQLTIAAEHLQDARQYDDARKLLESVLRLDPGYPRARDALAELDSVARLDAKLDQAKARFEAGDLAAAETQLREIIAQDPSYGPARRLLQQVRQKQNVEPAEPMVLKSALTTPISLDLRDTPMRNVFDALSQTAGLNFVFDRDVHTDSKITIFIRHSSIEDVLRLILSTNALERKILNENTVLIYPNTAAKAREYQELMVRTFYLVNADTKQVQSLLKSMAKIKEIYVDEKLNVVTIRDTPEAVRLAERLVDSVDVAEAEVMLEVEVMEIGRTRAQQLGLQFPNQATRGLNNGGSTLPTRQLGQTITTLTNPLLVANLFLQDQDANLLANPRIRVKNHEKAKVLIGEKLPVFTSTAVQNAGVSTSVSYIDIGLKLEVEPQIYLDDEVGIKVNLEVNSNLGQVTQGGSNPVTAYDVGTRSATTVLRLHDGETQVLAGLINDNDQATITRVPILGEIPAIGHLFSNDNSTREKTEIVLLITPRIIRNVVTPDYDTLLMPAGTEADVGSAGLAIGPTSPRSVSVAAQQVGRSGASGAAATPSTTPETAPAPAAPPQTAAQPAPSAPAASTAPSPMVALSAPPQAPPGGRLIVTVQVVDAASATEGEAVLSFDASVLRTADQAAGNVSIHLSPNGSGGLTGTAGFVVAATAGGSTEVRVLNGSALLPDGTRRSFDTSGAVATVRIGL